MTPPSDMKIAVLAAECFATAYDWTSHEAGNLEPVIHAVFEHPAAGRVDAFAKFCPLGGRAMVNEITGWLLAKAAGLPVPEVAFIALVPLDKLPQPLEGVAALALAEGCAHYPAFCTSSAAPTAVMPVAQTAALKDEMRRWEHAHACVAFDERTANTDRHLKNLVRRGLRDFVLIDHGRLAWREDQPEWNAASLADPLADYDNRLSGILWGLLPDRETAGAVVAAATRLRDGLAATEHELRYWWSILVQDEGDRAAWGEFLALRLESVEQLLAERFCLLDLSTR